MQEDRLTHLAARLRRHPGSIAHRLRHRTREEIAARLQIDQTAVTRLLLCHTPRSDQTAEDTEQIAGYVGTDAGTLASLLKP